MPDLVRGVFRSLEELERLEPRCHMLSIHRVLPAICQVRAPACPLAVSSRNAAIRSRSSSPPLSTTSVWRASGTSIQCGRRGEGVGEAACFVDRDDGVVGSMQDQGGTGDLSGRVDGPGRVNRHARQLAGPARDEPGHELRKGYHPSPQHEGHGHVEVDHGRFEHQGREATVPRRPFARRWPLPSNGPRARVERARSGRSPAIRSRQEVEARRGYPPPHGRRMSDKVRRSGHNLANRAPPRSSHAGSRRRRVVPRARTRLRQTREAGSRSFP